MSTPEEMLKQMYDSQLTSQKSQLQTDYETALSDLDAQKAEAKKNLDKNVRLTKTEAQKSAINANEYYAAAGLSSGAKAQARLAQDNQLLADLTAIRAAQQEADASVERSRSLLAKEYTAAIQKAQADNDLTRAQALYAEAKEADEKLTAKQEAAAGLMAQSGDFSRYGQLYGLTPAEIQTLNGTTSTATTSANSTGTVKNWDNGSLDRSQVKALQQALNVKGAKLTVDGLYGKNTQAAVNKYLGSGHDVKSAYDKLVTNTTTGSTFRDTFHTGGGSYYSQVLADMQQLKSSGRSSEISGLLQEAKIYLTTSEYMTLYNMYRNGKI